MFGAEIVVQFPVLTKTSCRLLSVYFNRSVLYSRNFLSGRKKILVQEVANHNYRHVKMDKNIFLV